jgi:hypothetical protein
MVLDYAQIVDFIKNYGFPIAVACWALWRLDKNWGGNTVSSSLLNIIDSQDRMETILQRNTEIQMELVTTMKIIQTIIGGEIRK